MDEIVQSSDVRAQRRKPFLSPRFVQAMLAGHSGLGLAFAALIYVVCLTGSVAVFLHELHRWEQPNIAPLTAPLKIESIQTAAVDAYAKAVADGAADDIFLSGPTALTPRFLVTYRGHEPDAEGEWIAGEDGKLLTRVTVPFGEFLGALHMNLHLPRTWGLFLVGLTGVALLSSLISGLLSHPRIFKDAFALRWGGSKRLQEADLHNRLSVWGLPFHFVVSLTGALLGLSTLIVGVLALAAYDGDSEKAFAALLGPHASESTVKAPVPNVGAMVKTVLDEHPDGKFVAAQLQHVGTDGQMVHLSVRRPGHLAFSNQYYFDGNGKSQGHGNLEEGGVGQQILGVLQPLHFGWFGGIGTKVFYGVLGLALTVITQSGVVIWLARRRDKGLPAELWERVWSAVVWGQPLALAVAAIVSLKTDEPWLIATYLAVTIGSIVFATVARSQAVVAYVLQSATALSLLALASAHAWIWKNDTADPMSMWIDGVVVIVAISIGLAAWRTVQKQSQLRTVRAIS